ncbi:hypothetical protein TYRP_022616 [Tyrophagus putrescentiae]|nr:hypothetical protein TYRP_022616 [Tyrophagus putrescentiae]
MKQSRMWFCSVVLNDTIYALGRRRDDAPQGGVLLRQLVVQAEEVAEAAVDGERLPAEVGQSRLRGHRVDHVGGHALADLRRLADGDLDLTGGVDGRRRSGGSLRLRFRGLGNRTGQRKGHRLGGRRLGSLDHGLDKSGGRSGGWNGRRGSARGGNLRGLRRSSGHHLR